MQQLVLFTSSFFCFFIDDVEDGTLAFSSLLVVQCYEFVFLFCCPKMLTEKFPWPQKPSPNQNSTLVSRTMLIATLYQACNQFSCTYPIIGPR
jgi:hypothetical protein